MNQRERIAKALECNHQELLSAEVKRLRESLLDETERLKDGLGEAGEEAWRMKQKMEALMKYLNVEVIQLEPGLSGVDSYINLYRVQEKKGK